MVKTHLDRKELLAMAFALLAPASSAFGYSYIDLGLYTKADTGVRAYASTTLDSGNLGSNSQDLGPGRHEPTAMYEQPGKLLTYFPITFSVRAILRDDGRVELDYPWYAFLIEDDRQALEERAEALLTIEAGGQDKAE